MSEHRTITRSELAHALEKTWPLEGRPYRTVPWTDAIFAVLPATKPCVRCGVPSIDVERLTWALAQTPVPLMNYRTYAEAAEAVAAAYSSSKSGHGESGE